jgi:hypothetical protein
MWWCFCSHARHALRDVGVHSGTLVESLLVDVIIAVGVRGIAKLLGCHKLWLANDHKD